MHRESLMTSHSEWVMVKREGALSSDGVPLLSQLWTKKKHSKKSGATLMSP